MIKKKSRSRTFPFDNMSYTPRSPEGEKRRLASLPSGDKHWRFDENPNVRAIHKWINRIYGRANRCENVKCEGKAKKYDWALIRGKEYKRSRRHFKQLCRSCHVKYDMTEARRKKIGENSIKMWEQKRNLNARSVVKIATLSVSKENSSEGAKK